MAVPVERTAEHVGRVLAVTAPTPRLRRVEIESPSLPTATLLQDVAVVLPEPGAGAAAGPDGAAVGGRTVRRRYTVRDARPGGLALEAVVHGHGPGSDWAAGVAVGDEVVLYGPRAGASLLTGERYLLLADEAGLPAVLELQRVLVDRAVTAVVEVADDAERWGAVSGVEWRPRSGRSAAGDPDLLLAAVDEFGPTASDAVYVLAESRVVATIRDRLLAAGVTRERLHAKGYWNRVDPRRAGSSA